MTSENEKFFMIFEFSSSTFPEVEMLLYFYFFFDLKKE